MTDQIYPNDLALACTVNPDDLATIPWRLGKVVEA